MRSALFVTAGVLCGFLLSRGAQAIASFAIHREIGAPQRLRRTRPSLRKPSAARAPARETPSSSARANGRSAPSRGARRSNVALG
jgi:hypothetical protein